MAHIKRPRAELVEHLKDQRAALAASCAGFDSGNQWEAARLATTVFTLLHDGGSIVSILTQLGLRASLRFVSTAHPMNPGNALPETPLIALRLSDKGATYVPAFGNAPFPSTRSQFPTWWVKELIYRDGGFELTRRRLVFALRHQDGGGHVGELTDEAYIRFKTKAAWDFVKEGSPPEPVYGAVAATMRQIAWEVTETLVQLGEVA